MPRCHFVRDNPYAVRSYRQIAEELHRRGDRKVSARRIQQICTTAERKLKEGMKREMEISR